jgi:hypothetical protein
VLEAISKRWSGGSGPRRTNCARARRWPRLSNRDPVLGLIFLAFAEHRFEELRPELQAKATARRPVSSDDYRARGMLYVPQNARLSYLVELPEGDDLGANRCRDGHDRVEIPGSAACFRAATRSSRRAPSSNSCACSHLCRARSPAMRVDTHRACDLLVAYGVAAANVTEVAGVVNHDNIASTAYGVGLEPLDDMREREGRIEPHPRGRRNGHQSPV